MVKQNLGKLDRIFRFVLALWLLGPWKPIFMTTWTNTAIIIIGLWVLIESFVGNCPGHDWFRVNNKNQ